MLSMKSLFPLVSDAHIRSWMERRNSTTMDSAVSLKAAGKTAALEAAKEALLNIADSNSDDAIAREKFTRYVDAEIRSSEELVLSEPHELDKAIYSGAVDGLKEVQHLLGL